MIGFVREWKERDPSLELVDGEGVVLFRGKAHPRVTDVLGRACIKQTRVEIFVRDEEVVQVAEVIGEVRP